MNIKRLSILIFFLFQLNLFAQSGMKLSEFTTKLERYFDKELISDISKEINVDLSIWGWDVGDFSGDGNNDVAFCTRKSGSKDKNMDVYLFADIDGFLIKVGQLQYEFVEIPLEVGVVFRNGQVYITEKYKQYHWKIDGYKFINGLLVNYDKYTTERKGNLTNESYHNYYNLRNTERYLTTSNGHTEFWADYYIIPSYFRNRFVYNGITTEALINDIAFCPAGAYWWQGDSDCSFSVSSVYDEEYIYFTVIVNDDSISRPYNDIENGEAIEFWIDKTEYNSNNSRFLDTNNTKDIVFKTRTFGNDSALFHFNIYLGDFVNKYPQMLLIDSIHNIANKNLSEFIVADLIDGGYFAIFKIPFKLLGIDAPTTNEVNITSIGATFRVIDVDNEFRPEQKTILQTSLFKEGDLSSMSEIVFIPDNEWYGEANNVYKSKIIETLEEMGF